MAKSIGIVGAGLLGRLLAHQLLLDGHAVHIFDRDDQRGTLSCGWVGAGMLAPYSELDSADEQIFSLGKESLALWPGIIKSLAKPIFFQHAGTLVVAHPKDRNELSRFQGNLERKLDLLRIQDQVGVSRRDARAPRVSDSFVANVDAGRIADLEPELAGRFHSGLYLADEGQIDNRQLFNALTDTLKANGVQWTEGVHIDRLEAHHIYATKSTKSQFDLVIDTRGLGAKTDLPKLRGVRGELIRVHAKEVNLDRPIRVMHPRYPLYIVPRPDNHYLIGATTIESEDDGPVTVQSALELLSAAFSVHSGFAEASVLEMTARCRPALIDNSPKIYHEPGLLRINGLYRHGFLISPKIVDLVTALIKNKLKVDSQLEIDSTYLPIIVENVRVENINEGAQYLPHSHSAAKKTNHVN
jgi:glycine oxidase